MKYYNTEQRASEVLRIMKLRAANKEISISPKLDVRYDFNKKKWYLGTFSQKPIIRTSQLSFELNGNE